MGKVRLKNGHFVFPVLFYLTGCNPVRHNTGFLPGSYTPDRNSYRWPSGAYFVRFTNASGEQVRVRLVKY